MSPKNAALNLTPAKRRLPDFDGDPNFPSRQILSAVPHQNGYLSDIFEHANNALVLNGRGDREKDGILVVDKEPFVQAYPDAPKRSFGTHYQDPFPPNASLVFEKESSGAAWNPLLNETSLTSSLVDFCASQRYQPNERHYVANSARNICGNTISFPNCADDGQFLLDSGLSTSDFISMPALSFIPTSTSLNMNPSVLGSDMVTNFRLPFPQLNVQGQSQSLKTSGCLSRSQHGHSFLTVPEQTFLLQYRRPLKEETQFPLQFCNTPSGASNPFQFCQKEGNHLGKKLCSPYKQDEISNTSMTMSSQSRIRNSLPRTKENGMQSPLSLKANLHGNKLAANGASNSMIREVVRLQSFLCLCKHALGCVESCNNCDCKLMKQRLNHCLNCHNNLCEQMCAPYKKLFGHYEKCCRSDCPICPPFKISLGNFQKLNSEITKVRTSIFTSDCDQSSVKLMMKGHKSSPCTSCASEVTDSEYASFSPQTHVSQSQELKTISSISERMRLEINQSASLSMTNNGNLFEPEVKNMNLARNLLQKASNDVVDSRLQNLQAPSSLSCEVENFEELTSTECTYLTSQQAILESQGLITSKDCVEEGIVLEIKPSGNQDSHEGSRAGLTPLVPQLQCKVLEASVNSIVKNMKGEDTCPKGILDACKLGYPEPKFGGLNMEIEVPRNVNPVSEEGIAAQTEQQVKQNCYEAEGEVNNGTTYSLQGPKLRKESERPISLLNLFTPEELRVHISSLRQCIIPDKATSQKMNWPKTQKNNPCSLCGVDKLLFHPPLRYCSACLKQIHPYGIYYSMKVIDKNGSSACSLKSFCNSCYAASRENIKFSKQSIRKVHLEQRTKYADTDAVSEQLVQCLKCKEWLHEICVLFNGKLNKEYSSQIEYTCPICCLREVENGIREPLLQRLVVGAKELPKTKLSDHIEQWLFRRLGEERQERAKKMGRSIDEVPTAEDLVVRVVSSVDTKFQVKPCFRAIFQEEKYPVEFAYKLKAVMLFQVIEGADVLLFAMYLQEYGSECSEPNRRYVCISYIDSAKYFRPEIRAVSGEALRTFVYHELLIGYLDYCKIRCFTSCYIWACPPSKDDDYILYCHPMTQKIPKSDKLREWYQKMIRKASKGKVVMENTNLYDHFFVQTSESKGKITTARLPYFDGDYWPGEAERLLQNQNGNKPEKKAKKAKAVIERALRAARRDASSIENEMDVLLMNNLGDTIRPMKEDFIILFLHHTCRHCCQPIISGGCWVCDVCKNFQLCGRCHSIEVKLQYKDRHPIKSRDKHSFHKVELQSVLRDTTDEDETVQCEIFNTRLEFLNFCQGNHYQFDTLRRAKHSTMMILDYLHNPAPPVFELSQIDGMVNAQGLHSVFSSHSRQSDLDYHKQCNAQHSLLPNTRLQSREKLTLMDALLHASKCGDCTCTYAHCRRLKVVFHHGVSCSIRKKGGCELCAKMWHLIFLHARSCCELECSVPRCKDMKEIFGGRPNRIDFRGVRNKEGVARQPKTEVFVGGS